MDVSKHTMKKRGCLWKFCERIKLEYKPLKWKFDSRRMMKSKWIRQFHSFLNFIYNCSNVAFRCFSTIIHVKIYKIMYWGFLTDRSYLIIRFKLYQLNQTSLTINFTLAVISIIWCEEQFFKFEFRMFELK